MRKRRLSSRMRQWIRHQWLHGREWLECHYCGARLTFDEITLDHVKPHCKRGGDWIGNLIPACKCCNEKRAAKPYADFIREIAA